MNGVGKFACGVMLALSGFGIASAGDYSGPYLEVKTGSGPFVDTGVQAKPDTKVEYWFDLQKNAYSGSYCLMGALGGGLARYFILYCDGASGLLFANNGSMCYDSRPSPSGWHYAVVDNGASVRAASVDGVAFQTVPTAPPTLSCNIFAFAYANNGSSANGYAQVGTRMGVIRIWQDGSLVRVMIPAQDALGVKGYDDLVSGSFIPRKSANANDFALTTASGFRVGATAFVGTPSPDYGFAPLAVGDTQSFEAPKTVAVADGTYYCNGWTLEKDGVTLAHGEGNAAEITLTDANDNATFRWNYAAEPIVEDSGIMVVCEKGRSSPEAGFFKMDLGATQRFDAPSAPVTNRAASEVSTCIGWRLTLADASETEGPETSKTITLDAANDRATLTWRFETVAVELPPVPHYVVPAGTPGNVPAPPYDGWASAANSIEDALAACLPGEAVVLGPGTYGIANRITVDKRDVTICAQNPDGSDATGKVILDAGFPARTTGIFNLAAEGVKLRGLVLRGRDVAAAPAPVEDPDTRPVPVVPARDPKAKRDMKGSWLALGDSITYYNDHLGEAQVKNGRSITKGYQTRVRETLTFSGYANLAINGAKVGDLLTRTISAYDYVTIAVGVNDCGGWTPMGDFDDFTDAAKRASAETFYARYGRLIDKVRAANANAKIILCTPRHAYGFVTAQASAGFLPPFSTQKGAIGFSLEDYAKAIRKMARHENLPVCDFFAFCGDDATVGRESIDVALHPDDCGYARMADELLKVFAAYGDDGGDVPGGESEPGTPTGPVERDPNEPRDMNGSWCCLGDSITYFNDHIGEAQVKNGTALTEGYQTRVKKVLTFTGYSNIAVSGGQIGGLVLNSIPKADYYTIAYGVNDWARGQAITYSTNADPLDDYKNRYGISISFQAYYRKAINKIRELNANAKIILCTPRRAYGYSGYLPESSSAASLQGQHTYLADYVDTIRRIAEYEGLEVADFYATCGDDSVLAAESIDTALHPNDLGYAKYATELLRAFSKVD